VNLDPVVVPYDDRALVHVAYRGATSSVVDDDGPLRMLSVVTGLEAPEAKIRQRGADQQHHESRYRREVGEGANQFVVGLDAPKRVGRAGNHHREVNASTTTVPPVTMSVTARLFARAPRVTAWWSGGTPVPGWPGRWPLVISRLP